MNLLTQFKNEPNFLQVCKWAEKFNKAEKIKKLCSKNSYLYSDKTILDKRMCNVWTSVINIEPVKTFVDGNLTRDARGLLNMYKIYKAFKK